MVEVIDPRIDSLHSLRFHPAVDPWPEGTKGPRADRHLALIRDGAVHARCSLWWSGTAPHQGRATCYLGHLAGLDGGCVTELLSFARRRDLIAARIILGPIDGDTWHRYRVVTDQGIQPPFPLEPANPEWWPAAFEDAGFQVVESYWSAVRDLRRRPVDVPPDAPKGVVVRRLDRARLDEELDAIYGLAVEAFASNPLYTPIDLEAFRAMYRPIAYGLDPGLCLIAETDRPVGLMLAIPAHTEHLMLKTIAVDERMRGKGLGNCLLATIARYGQDLGFTHLIYALMHESNRSSEMVRRLAEPMRRYALYGFGGAP